MSILTENPEESRGRANAGATSYSYPLNESLPSSLRLRFIEYNRFNPAQAESTERTTAIITLPLPVTVPENYSIRNESTSLGVWGNITSNNWDKVKGAAGAEPSDDPFQDTMDLAKMGVSAGVQRIRTDGFRAIAALAGVGLAGRGAEDSKAAAASAFAGIVRNPHSTIVFEGVNLRGINFEWRFSPRSEDETRALQNIYNTLKLRMHPEELASGFSLNYPDLCLFEFQGKGAEFFPKYQKAFINNVNITPDSNNGMPLFKTGAPVTYSLQISGMEVSILTRNSIQEQINGTV